MDYALPPLDGKYVASAGIIHRREEEGGHNSSSNRDNKQGWIFSTKIALSKDAHSVIRDLVTGP